LFIAQHKKTWPVDVMCRLMGINRNGYYSYQRRQRNLPDDPERQDMLEWVKKIAEASQYTYGSRRIRKALNGLGYPIELKKAKCKGTDSC
jgi:putative transposase